LLSIEDDDIASYAPLNRDFPNELVPTTIPGLSSGFITIFEIGKRLQMRLLLTGGTFNLKAMPLHVRKAWSLARRRLGRLGRRVVP